MKHTCASLEPRHSFSHLYITYISPHSWRDLYFNLFFGERLGVVCRGSLSTANTLGRGSALVPWLRGSTKLVCCVQVIDNCGKRRAHALAATPPLAALTLPPFYLTVVLSRHTTFRYTSPPSPVFATTPTCASIHWPGSTTLAGARPSCGLERRRRATCGVCSPRTTTRPPSDHTLLSDASPTLLIARSFRSWGSALGFETYDHLCLRPRILWMREAHPA